MTAQINEQVFK